MLPSVIKSLSKTRSRTSFPKTPAFDDKYQWEKAQKLVKYIKEDEEIHIFTTKQFLDLGLKTITNRLITKYLEAWEKSKTWKEFKSSKIFHIYNKDTHHCDCYNFWHRAYCKHSLASMIYQKKIKVFYLLFDLIVFRFLINIPLRK